MPEVQDATDHTRGVRQDPGRSVSLPRMLRGLLTSAVKLSQALRSGRDRVHIFRKNEALPVNVRFQVSES